MLTIVPCELDEANAFVERVHRHHRPVVGHKFSIAVSNESGIVGVAIVGRPVARMLDDSWTLEVTRLATDGTKNACSVLYAACWRAARADGLEAASDLHSRLREWRQCICGGLEVRRQSGRRIVEQREQGAGG